MNIEAYITEKGQLVRSDELWMTGLLNDRELLVQRLGFIAICSSRRATRVRLNLNVASSRAVISTRDYLRRNKPARTVLVIIEPDGSNRSFISGWERACLEIAAAITRSRFDRPQAHISRPLDEGGLAKFPILAELRRLWASTASSEFVTKSQDILHGMQGVRCVLADCDLASGTTLIRHMSGSFPAFDDKWMQLSVGLRVQDQCDYGYGRWIANTYAEVASSGTVLIDDVDAEIAHPRSGLVRSRYRRLILPVASCRSDCITLLSANILDRTIDLRSIKFG
jgi:hypothetical protein